MVGGLKGRISRTRKRQFQKQTLQHTNKRPRLPSRSAGSERAPCASLTRRARCTALPFAAGTLGRGGGGTTAAPPELSAAAEAPPHTSPPPVQPPAPPFFFNDTATPQTYTLYLHDALPLSDVKSWRFLFFQESLCSYMFLYNRSYIKHNNHVQTYTYIYIYICIVYNNLFIYIYIYINSLYIL